MKNADLIQGFLKNTGTVTGSNANRSINFSFPKFYSYNTLMAVVKNQVLFVNPQRYSVTTSTIVNQLKSEAIRQGYRVVQDAADWELVKFANPYTG